MILVPFFVIFALSECHNPFNTEYSNNGIPHKWNNIRVGDSVESVYRELGSPLHVDINPDGTDAGAANKQRTTQVELASIACVISNPNSVLYLNYSWPDVGSRGYYRYQIEIRRGKVADLSSGELID